MAMGFFKRRRIVVLLVVMFVTFLFIYINHIEVDKKWNKLLHYASGNISGFINEQVYVTVVACGERLEETLTMIKSALIFNKMGTLLNFQIITEDFLKEKFETQLVQWQAVLVDKFSFEIYSLHFPQLDGKVWRDMFKPCAAQRLFLPTLLNDIDATIYVDTDIVFLSPATDLWAHFKLFNASHIAGLSPEHEVENIGWYNRFARHPFFGKLGVNSGVMLMNLTKMRMFGWEKQILPIHSQYKSQITWGDQDLINILFYFYPDKLYIFPCIYNYRPDHCMYMNVCNVTDGIRVLHGNRGYFHSNKQPIFKTVFEAYRDFRVENNVSVQFLRRLSNVTKNWSVKNSSCGKILGRIFINL